MVQTLAIGIAAGYGALALAGGILGYVKASSRASLIAGGISGALLCGGAAIALSQPATGLSIAGLASLALVARFGRSAIKQGKPNPIGYLMIGGGLAVIASAALALV